jgi:hypothetical protein
MIIAKFNGGVATKAILPNLKNFAKQEPDVIKLYSNSLPSQASDKTYQRVFQFCFLIHVIKI